ncbi:LysR family transcriptional regulator [Acinetobacter qingfengensis]|uniref:LysR family transcriptional regulator n=1 Tax=Acinetobacter qingfengensis TaxID=1262585 RepID=A0A1E7R2U1_9GAMM|nr:LysR family transcriptional regulator [Acinetobacter qingfengensis]KAA8733939.1 LysR family transcriptional regulator [Acinetobacter qingfengensis]OEY93648.1 LysR family transcriptional regulator [Acinetobacter qingfengensis]
MNIATFEAFIKVMETGSISIAAEKLFVTQPAVTKRIHSLEDYLGIKLFEAVGRGIQPNQTAHQILPRIKQWLYELEDIQRDASQAQQNIQGKLKIGTSHHIGLHHLPKYLKPFAQHYPQVELDIQFVDSERAHQLVLAGDIELAFLTLPPQNDPRLHYQPLWQDPLIFVAAPFHPLAQQKQLQLQDLTRFPSLLPAAHTYTSQITLAEFEKHHLKPQISMTTNPLESIRMLVSIGLGWSVLPQTLINQDLQVLQLDIHLQRQLGMVWHPERSQSKAMQTLMQMILHSDTTV